jgi:hypothetical protein
MCIADIRERAIAGGYANFQVFADDVYHMFINCRIYNDPQRDFQVYNDAVELEKAFVKFQNSTPLSASASASASASPGSSGERKLSLTAPQAEAAEAAQRAPELIDDPGQIRGGEAHAVAACERNHLCRRPNKHRGHCHLSGGAGPEICTDLVPADDDDVSVDEDGSSSWEEEELAQPPADGGEVKEEPAQPPAECAICLDVPIAAVTTPCGHRFCTGCIAWWMHGVQVPRHSIILIAIL